MYKKQIPTEARRQLMLSVIDGDPRLTVIMHNWNGFARVDEILAWCLKQKLTGKNLYAWLRQEFSQSILNPVHFILAKIDRDPRYRPIIVGRDFIGNQGGIA